MPSPFPGMDPYIESWIWGDFHARLVPRICDHVNARLPRRYIANIELYIWREAPHGRDRQLLGGPDTDIADRRAGRSGKVIAGAVLDAPFTTVLPRAEQKQRYLRILDNQERRIVTVVEVLSPANKTTGETGTAYRMKREEYLGSGINLVEIDLLRAGIRPPLGDPAPPVGDYYFLVSRAEEKPRLGIWPFSVRDPIPSIPMPLDPGVAEVILDLPACVNQTYDSGRYGDQLDYTRPPELALREPDAAWARDLLTSRTKPARTPRGKKS